ncbi:MAG: HAMP domain-containing sensor histidine kinase [Campylobacterota bacterium]|nr:HAMP domain-containing sensor histidine kinase [Campylobacterota bacterium]
MAVKKSIRRQFLIQLIFASASLIFIFSSALYFMIKDSIYTEKKETLLQVAHNICSYQSLENAKHNPSDAILGLSIELLNLDNIPENQIYINSFQKEKRTYLKLIYPFNEAKREYLSITKDITTTEALLSRILNSIFIINAIGFLVVILYAIGLSKMLISPVTTLSNRLSNMNEHLIRPIKVRELPEEFEPLGDTLNRLIKRIQNFVKYQKELFIGAAHELKTPLAVIKLKNQVTLIKKRSPEEYIEAIKITNTTIDEMDKIVGDILNMGRQEGAQLETPDEVDVIALLQKKSDDFLLLAKHEDKELITSLEPNLFMATLQVKLLNQIIQNFLQNALKFTPKGKKVTLKSSQHDKGLLIEVIDEGCGVDDSIDLFAPFMRQGNKSGVGLGLFLAKSAAEAIGGEIAIKNRSDGIEGSVASLLLESKLCCPIRKP